MSDTFLVVIPRDPHTAIPAKAEAARVTLAKIAGTQEARIKDYGKLQFIDCGEAFDYVACPACETKLTLEQWRALMDKDWHGEDGFHLDRHTMPCCAACHSLNDLTYHAPQGFARWFISARTINRGALSDTELAQVEKAADVQLRGIIQQY